MRFLLIQFILFIWLLPFNLFAQIPAITNTGDEVSLYSDGTWKYVADSLNAPSEIILNQTPFNKSDKLSFLVKSSAVNVGVWIDPVRWSFTKSASNDAAEYQFQLKKGDLYALLIAERMEIPLESLKQIAIDNARGAAPDVQVVHEEYRIVNGIKLLMMQLEGTISGIKFVYNGYYFSNENGTVQLISYTGKSLMNEYMPDIEMFLNGFVELPKEGK